MQLNLCLVLWNPNVLQNSKAIVEHHLKTHQIDILLGAETHFSPRSHFSISGYDIIQANHPSGRAAILTRSGIQYIELSAFQHCWAQCLVFRISSLQGDIRYLFLPRYRITGRHLNELFEHLRPRFIAAEDFNAKHSWSGSRANNPKGKAIFEYLQRNSLDCHCTGEPTRLTTDPLKTPNLSVLKGIGHAKISCTINVLLNTPVLRKVPLRKHTDAAFASWMISAHNPNLLPNTPRDIDDAIGHLTREIQNNAEFAVPPREHLRETSTSGSRKLRHSRLKRGA